MSLATKIHSWKYDKQTSNIRCKGLNHKFKAITLDTKYNPCIYVEYLVTNKYNIMQELQKFQIFLSSKIPIIDIKIQDYVVDDPSRAFNFIPIYKWDYDICTGTNIVILQIRLSNNWHLNKLKYLLEKSKLSFFTVDPILGYFISNYISPTFIMRLSNIKNRSNLPIFGKLKRLLVKQPTYINKQICYLVVHKREYHILDSEKKFHIFKTEGNTVFPPIEMKEILNSHILVITDTFEYEECVPISNSLEISKAISLISTNVLSSEEKAKVFNVILDSPIDKLNFNAKLFSSRDISALENIQRFFKCTVKDLNDMTLEELFLRVSRFYHLTNYGNVKDTIDSVFKKSTNYVGKAYLSNSNNILQKWFSECGNHEINKIISIAPYNAQISKVLYNLGFVNLSPSILYNVLEKHLLSLVENTNNVVPEDIHKKKLINKLDTLFLFNNESFSLVPSKYKDPDYPLFRSNIFKSHDERQTVLDDIILYIDEDIFVLKYPLNLYKHVKLCINTPTFEDCSQAITESTSIIFDDISVPSIGWLVQWFPMSHNNKYLLTMIISKDDIKSLKQNSQSVGIGIKKDIAYRLRAIGFKPEKDFFSIDYKFVCSEDGIIIESDLDFGNNDNIAKDIYDQLDLC